MRTLLPREGCCLQVLPPDRWGSHGGVNPGVGVRAFLKRAAGSVCAEQCVGCTEATPTRWGQCCPGWESLRTAVLPCDFIHPGDGQLESWALSISPPGPVIGNALVCALLSGFACLLASEGPTWCTVCPTVAR